MMEFLDSIRSPELKKLGTAAIECDVSLWWISHTAGEIRKASIGSAPLGVPLDATRKLLLAKLQAWITSLFDDRAKLREALPSMERHLIRAIPAKRRVFGQSAPSFCRGLLRTTNELLSEMDWPSGRPEAALNCDAALRAFGKCVEYTDDYLDYADDSFIDYAMDYTDEPGGTGAFCTETQALAFAIRNELILADEILAGGRSEPRAGDNKIIDAGKPNGSHKPVAAPAVRKIRPKDDTLRIIEDLKRGMDVDALADKHKTSAENIRQIASRLGRGEYDLTKPRRPKRDTE
jgi:hypothetical protein